MNWYRETTKMDDEQTCRCMDRWKDGWGDNGEIKGQTNRQMAD